MRLSGWRRDGSGRRKPGCGPQLCSVRSHSPYWRGCHSAGVRSDKHREALGRLRLAGIGADTVAVAGQLGEALSGLVGRHRSVVDLTADRPLEHARIDEGGFGMRVAGRVAARRQASFFDRRKDGSPLTLQQHHDEPGRLPVAGVAPHDVNHPRLNRRCHRGIP